ncbi:DUF6069 family protein [Cellulomonas sp. Marseille-Q8402]
MTTLTTQPPRPLAVPQVAVAAVVALAANVVVLWFATALGVTFQVGTPQPVTALAVAVLTVGPLALGAPVVALAARRRPDLQQPAAWAGLAVALLTTAGPFLAARDLGTAAALSLMHVVVGIAWLAALRHPTAP